MLDKQTVEIWDGFIFKEKQFVPKKLRPSNICEESISLNTIEQRKTIEKHTSPCCLQIFTVLTVQGNTRKYVCTGICLFAVVFVHV